MKDGKENYNEYDEMLLLYLSGVLEKEENLKLNKIIEENQRVKFRVEEMEELLIALSETYGKEMRSMKAEILNNILNL